METTRKNEKVDEHRILKIITEYAQRHQTPQTHRFEQDFRHYGAHGGLAYAILHSGVIKKKGSGLKTEVKWVGDKPDMEMALRILAIYEERTKKKHRRKHDGTYPIIFDKLQKPEEPVKVAPRPEDVLPPVIATGPYQGLNKPKQEKKVEPKQQVMEFEMPALEGIRIVFKNGSVLRIKDGQIVITMV